MGAGDSLIAGGKTFLCFFLSVNGSRGNKMVFRVLVDRPLHLRLFGTTDTIWSYWNRTQRQRVHTPAPTPRPTSNSMHSGEKPPEKTVQDTVHIWAATPHSGDALPLDCTDQGDMDARQGMVSCPQAIASRSHVADHISAVINLEEGKVHSIVWDNGCSACGGPILDNPRCLRNSQQLHPGTYIEGPELTGDGVCATDRCEAAGCDLNVFVTWAGTDSEGNHLLSAGQRISLFEGATFSSMVSGGSAVVSAIGRVTGLMDTEE